MRKAGRRRPRSTAPRTQAKPPEMTELAEAADERVLSRVLARYGRVELLCVDQLGYLGLDPRGAELLFQVLIEREERSSVATASNSPFSEWGRTFADPRVLSR